MAAKIASIQQPDGLWHSSLLDPQTYKDPETSGTGFFCYSLAWGINHGLLDRAMYLPVVKKAWAGLIDCVHPDGKLGWVQPPGGSPKSRYTTGYDVTENYGVGAFLLAGSEVYKLAEAQ
ncbi:MAG: glycoside hydrolase family 88 protein, partial [Sedimentisphaerales bacterium]|nr:glycoside hydrolase family 88 protein [Sedimentisphaerales bacterium]